MTAVDHGNKGLGSHVWDTLVLAVPVIAGQLGHIAINQADTIMVGGLGSKHLAAATLAGGAWIFFAIIGMGLLASVGTLTAQWGGAGKSKAEMGSLLQQSVLVSFFIGVLIWLALLVVAEFLGQMGQPDDVVQLAVPFLRIIALSTIPMMVFLAIKAFVEGFEVTWPGMMVTGFMVLFNVFFNWVLIYGNLGFPELGLNGAGWATLVARTVGMLLMAWFVLQSPAFKEYWPRKDFFRVKWQVMREVLRIGLPSGMQYFFEVGAFSGAVFLAGTIGKDAMSAHQIAISAASVTFMFYLGFSIAASIRVGSALGRDDRHAIRMAGKAGFICGAVAIVVFATTMILLRKWLPTLYIDNPEVVLLTVPLLVIAAIFQLFDGIQAIGVGVLRGMSDVKIPTLSTFVAYWVIGLPSAALLMFEFDMGLEGIWYGLTAGLAFSSVAMSLRFFWKTKPSAQNRG